MELQALQQECLACRRCGLCETRHSVVFGQGAAHAEVMLVGEGPGANEDEQGLPFVGKSGQLLDHYLEAVDLSRDKNVYIANIVCLGRVAAQRMLDPGFSISRDHGKFFDKQGTLFMATYHPAALLRYPDNKPAVFGDFVALRQKITEVCEHTY